MKLTLSAPPPFSSIPGRGASIEASFRPNVNDISLDATMALWEWLATAKQLEQVNILRALLFPEEAVQSAAFWIRKPTDESSQVRPTVAVKEKGERIYKRRIESVLVPANQTVGSPSTSDQFLKYSEKKRKGGRCPPILLFYWFSPTSSETLT